MTNEESLVNDIKTTLESIQSSLFQNAKAARDEKIIKVYEWKDFVPAIDAMNMVLTPFCDEMEWEEKVKVSLYASYSK